MTLPAPLPWDDLKVKDAEDFFFTKCLQKVQYVLSNWNIRKGEEQQQMPLKTIEDIHIALCAQHATRPFSKRFERPSEEKKIALKALYKIVGVLKNSALSANVKISRA